MLNYRNQILHGDVFDKLAELPEKSVHCCVTSPPYWQVRSYGIAGEFGMESTMAEYQQKMESFFLAVKRVLRDDGIFWVNLGDKYKDHQRMLLPERMAIMAQDQGWLVRQRVVWHKPNVCPESSPSRPHTDYEDIYMFTKGKKYYYDPDAVRISNGKEASLDEYLKLGGDYQQEGKKRYIDGFSKSNHALTHPGGRNLRAVWTLSVKPRYGHQASFPVEIPEKCILGSTSAHGCCPVCGAQYRRITALSPEAKAKMGKSWHDHQDDIGTGQRGTPTALKGPQKYTIGWKPDCDCGCPNVVPAVVLDPFMGSGTTAIACIDNGRDYIGIELNQEYINTAEKRIFEFKQQIQKAESKNVQLALIEEETA